MPVVGPILCAVDKVCVVIAGAVETAIAYNVWVGQVCSKLLGLTPPIIDGVLLVRKDVAIGNQDVVDANALTGIRQMKSVVLDICGVRILESVQVPIHLQKRSVAYQKQEKHKHTCELSMMGVLLVVAKAVILMSHS